MRLEKDPQEVDHCVSVTEVSRLATRSSKSKFTAEVNGRPEIKRQCVSLTLRINVVHACSMVGGGLLYFILLISYSGCSAFLKL